MQDEHRIPIVSVLTPTYNRGHLLRGVYDCLVEQTFKEFEWLIIDDGSNDKTTEISESIIAENLLDVKYLFRENGGRHRAINYGVDRAKGRFVTELHSDDRFVPVALETFLRRWEEIPDDFRNTIGGVVALCAEQNGSVIGGSLSQDYIDCDAIEIRTKYGRIGDFTSMHRTDVRKEFPFPEIPGENYVPPVLLWSRIAQKYSFRYVNEVLQIKQYLRDGITAERRGVIARAPKALRLRYEEIIAARRALPVGLKIKNCINYIRFSLHAGDTLWNAYYKIPAKDYFIVSAPLGIALYYRDRMELLKKKSYPNRQH